MKNLKVLSAILCIAILLCACKTVNGAGNIQLYYLNTTVYNNTDKTKPLAISEESSDLTTSAKIEVLLNRYFSGPESENLSFPFPDSVNLVSFSLESQTLTFVFSNNFKNLSDITRTLAMACLTKTCCQLTSVDSACFLTEDGSFNSGILSSDEISIEDTTSYSPLNTITVYYPDLNNRYVIPVSYQSSIMEDNDKVLFILNKLKQQPDNDSVHTLLNTDVSILNVNIDSGICAIDISDNAFSGRAYTDSEASCLLISIVNSVTELDSVDSVRFYINGENSTPLNGSDLSIPYERDESRIGPVLFDFNESDVSIYLIRMFDKQAVELPCRLKTGSAEITPDFLIRYLIDYRSLNGLTSPFSDRTAVFETSMDGTTCTVRFGADTIVKMGGSTTVFVDCIRLSLLSLESISSVNIYIGDQLMY